MSVRARHGGLPRSTRLRDAGVFLTFGILAAGIYIGVTELVWGYGFDPVGYAVLFGALAGSTLAALPAHYHAPDYYQDRFHRFGVLFAMFIPINIVLSITLILAVFIYDGLYGPVLSAEFAWTFGVAFAVSSVFLPAPYTAAVLSRRWISR